MAYKYPPPTGQLFTGNGTFTAPDAGLYLVKAWGGGGGGGGGGAAALTGGTSTQVGGGGGGSTSPIEETVTAGNSSLQYDPGTQRYIYVWKTDKAWAGTCRQLIVKLIDGTEHSALFQFNGKGRSAEAGESGEGEAVARQQIFLPLVNNQ